MQIVRREYVERQEEVGQRIYPDCGRSRGGYLVRDRHERLHYGQRYRFAHGAEQHRDHARGQQTVSEGLCDRSRFARSVGTGNERLYRLPDTVGDVLRDEIDIDDDSVYRQRRGAEVFHDLIVEYDREYPDGYIYDKRRKTRCRDPADIFCDVCRSDQPQSVPLAEEVRAHYTERQHLPQPRGQPRSLYAHICGKDEQVVAHYVEQSARYRRYHCESGRSVVAQKRREDLSEREQGHDEFQPFEVISRERQNIVVGARQPQQRRVGKGYRRPCDGGDDCGGDHGKREDFVGIFEFAFSAEFCENYGTAYPEEKTEAYDYGPDGRYYGKRRRPARTFVLTDHYAVDDGVDRHHDRAAYA